MIILKDKIGSLIFLGLIILFALLIYKDPFSQRTLIPNFEPYPDTFNYITPALNLIRGKGLNMNREGREYKPNVPPLYSLSLIPAFIIKQDPRMSYYTNVVLAFIALVFFWAILKKISDNKLIIYTILILYITNYFIYWVPSIILAENLILTLSLVAIYFLLLEVSLINSTVISVVAVGLYATKFSIIPISVLLTFLYLIRIWINKTSSSNKFKMIVYSITATALFYSLLATVEWITKGNNIFIQVYEHILRIYHSIIQSDIGSDGNATKQITYSSSWFGIEYIEKHFPSYLRVLLGSPDRFLWDFTPLVPNFIAIPAMIGLFSSLLIKNTRLIALILLLLMFGLITFMSTFYSFDTRYIYITIPILLIGFGLLLRNVENNFFRKKKLLLNILVLIFLCLYFLTNAIRIKSQISLNLRYTETPWNYISILKMNEYFIVDKIVNGKKPVLISALPPLLIDYYSNGNYTLLPLSYEQEFRRQDVRELVWGPNDYSDLPKLYTKYLLEGYEVYVSRAGLGNEGYTNNDFNTIVERFGTKLVLPGCYDQCNIYSVKLKDKNGK
ncbi:hypothetical protein HYS96_04620 [Candidatus Daviesbacteria bacterium]|nr:hypothetical protein [Candidatus Daviesbacteria bacterium]